MVSVLIRRELKRAAPWAAIFSLKELVKKVTGSTFCAPLGRLIGGYRTIALADKMALGCCARILCSLLSVARRMARMPLRSDLFPLSSWVLIRRQWALMIQFDRWWLHRNALIKVDHQLLCDNKQCGFLLLHFNRIKEQETFSKWVTKDYFIFV